MRIAFIVLLALHGIAHLPGFVVAWQFGVLRDMPYHTTLLSGRMDVGDGGIRVLGVLWLLVGVAFEIAAAGAIWHKAWWAPLTAVAAAISLGMTLLQLPEARIGAVVNVVILCLLALGQYATWEKMIL